MKDGKRRNKTKKEETVEMSKKDSLSKSNEPSIAFSQWEKVAPKIGANMIRVKKAIAERERRENEKTHKALPKKK